MEEKYLESEEKELNERLQEIQKQRDEEELILQKLSQEEMAQFLLEKYKQNAEILKKGNFNVIDGGER